MKSKLAGLLREKGFGYHTPIFGSALIVAEVRKLLGIRS